MKKNPRFESFYKKFSIPLTRFIAKRIGADQRATEEIFEETMVAAWKGLKTFRHKSSYFTWLCRISLNKISDYYKGQINRNSQIVVPIIEALTETDRRHLSPDEKMILEELRVSVNKCLDLMSPQKRRYLQFRYWQDLSYSQIAKIVGTSIRAVEGQIYRAKGEFAKVWHSFVDSRNPE